MAISSLGNYTLKAPGRASGVFLFEGFDANGVGEGAVDFGYCDAVNQTVDTGTETEIRSRRSAARPVVASFDGESSRTITVTTNSVSEELRALWLAMTKETVSQSATPVANEEITNIIEGHFYYLGISVSNPTGIKGAASFTLTNFDATKAAWQATTAYAVGDNVEKVVDDGKVFRCKTAGTSGGTEPTWVTSALGDETTDGTVVWEYIAAANTTYTENTHYETDLSAATGARFLWISTTLPPYLYANYTPTANSRTRYKTGDALTKSGRARFDAVEPDAHTYTWRSVTLKPTGDLAGLGDESTQQQLSFELTVLEPSDSTSAIYVDEDSA